jgi:hypothetical protein
MINKHVSQVNFSISEIQWVADMFNQMTKIWKNECINLKNISQNNIYVHSIELKQNIH